MKKIFQIVSDNSKASQKPVLSFCIGQNHCCFAITENEGTALKSLYYYSTANMNVDHLNEIWALHPQLQDDFLKILIGYDYTQNILSPAPEMNRTADVDFPMNILTIHPSSVKFSEKISKRSLQNTYWVPAAIHEWVISKFRSGKYRHHDSVLLEQDVTDDEKGYMDIDFRTEEFVLMVTKADRLLLVQAYTYASPGDVLYYLLKACHLFLFDQNEVKVRLSGLIDINSSLYNELHQYFINIGFREATWHTTPSDLPAHFFTSLNDLARCE